jgi:uracil-DNA glycosylase
MSLNLDKRRRAMLREMGVRVWQPLAPVVAAQVAIEVVADSAEDASAGGGFHSDSQQAKASAGPVAPHRARDAAAVQGASPPAAPNLRPAAETPGSRQASWRLGDEQALYAPGAQAGGARWLVLAETPAGSVQSPVFEGDAGRLLDNMLRAARLNRAGAVRFAPLVRHAAADESVEEFSAALTLLLAQAQPDVVLVMGRLAALALLSSSEPFGKLRGRIHILQGVKTIVSYDAAYLLRAPADKARAWDDLCLAMSVVAGATALS